MSRELLVMKIFEFKLYVRLFASLILLNFVAAFTLAMTASSQAAEAKLRLAVLGDSLTAGYGLAPGKAFPEQLATKLQQQGYDIEVINAGVSGDTSSGGLARLDWSLEGRFDLVIIELGANDALRGLPVEVTRKNLDTIITKLKDKNMPVLLTGMLAPPNMGADYGAAFMAIYSDLAKKHEIAFYPFFLDGVAGNTKLNQPDGIHPTQEGVAIIVERILASITTLLDKAKH